MAGLQGSVYSPAGLALASGLNRRRAELLAVGTAPMGDENADGFAARRRARPEDLRRQLKLIDAAVAAQAGARTRSPMRHAAAARGGCSTRLVLGTLGGRLSPSRTPPPLHRKWWVTGSTTWHGPRPE